MEKQEDERLDDARWAMVVRFRMLPRMEQRKWIVRAVRRFSAAGGSELTEYFAACMALGRDS